jgi:hypothetical protein
MSNRIQIRRDTSIAWEANNPVLALGEPGLETDTFIVKYGDGSSAWNDLPYANIDSLSDFTTTNLAEGSRLYFTNARVYANIVNAGFISSTFATNAQLASYATNAQLSLYATNSQLGSYATNNQLALYATNSQLGSYATNNQLTLYATNAQLVNYVTQAQLYINSTTANITELSSNLYYTNTRVYENVLSLGHATNAQLTLYTTNSQINALTTAAITESGNLYFTNARVTSALTSNTANITLGNVLRLVNYTYDEMEALTGAQKGWIIFETSNNVFRGYNGTAWSNLG